MDIIQSHRLSFAEKRKVIKKSLKKASKSRRLKSRNKKLKTKKNRTSKSSTSNTKRSTSTLKHSNKHSFYRRSTLNPDSFIQIARSSVHKRARKNLIRSTKKMNKRQPALKRSQNNKKKVNNKRIVNNSKKVNNKRPNHKQLRRNQTHHNFKNGSKRSQGKKRNGSLKNKKRVAGKKIQ